MKPPRVGLISAIFVFFQFLTLAAETVLLRSGKEVDLIQFGLLCARRRKF